MLSICNRRVSSGPVVYGLPTRWVSLCLVGIWKSNALHEMVIDLVVSTSVVLNSWGLSDPAINIDDIERATLECYMVR